MGQRWTTSLANARIHAFEVRPEHIAGSLVTVTGVLLLSRGLALDGDMPTIAGALLIVGLGVLFCVARFGSTRRVLASERRYRELFDGSSVAIWEQDWSAVADRIEGLCHDRALYLRDLLDDDTTILASVWSKVRIVGRNAAARSFTASVTPRPSEGEPSWYPLSDVIAKDVLIAFAEATGPYEAEMTIRSSTGPVQALIILADFPPQGRSGPVIVSIIDVSRRRQETDDLLRDRWRLGEASRAAAARVMTRLMVSEFAARHLTARDEAMSLAGDFAGTYPTEADRSPSAALSPPSQLVQRGRELLSKAPGRLEPIVLADLLVDAVALLGPELEDNDVTVHVIVEPDLPEVTADRAELTGVVAGLIENSVDAMAGASSRERNLTISAQRHDDDEVLVVVADSGPGADRPQWTHMFEPLVSTKTCGVGLGLTVFREAVEATGGRIWASAGANGGLSLRFTLPANG